MDLVGRIDTWGDCAPDRVAHISQGGRLTYGELASASEALAAFIQETLGDDGSPIVVLGHKEPEMLVAFLGSVKAGHPYVPIDSSLPRARQQRIIETAQARLTLTREQIREAARQPSRPSERALANDDPFYVMFTSGSTGEPKGVTITLGCLRSFVDWMLAEHEFELEKEVFLNQAPFSFDLSVMDTYLALVTGGTLVSLTTEQIGDPRLLYDGLRQSRVTTWVSTPSFAQLCLGEASFDATMLPNVRRFLFCGETLPPHVAARLLDRFPDAQVWNTYGPTEATVATTSVRIDRAAIERYATLPVGQPKPGTDVVVREGEIVIAGPNVSPGYLNRPDLTQQRFFTLGDHRAYRTGDRGHFDADGLLFFDGRIDDQVKLHGYRIELGDVEANLRCLEGVCDAVVVPVMRDAEVDALAAFIRADARSDESDFERSTRIRRALRERLPAYMVPRVVQTVATYPMTPNGKVDRRALAKRIR